MITDVNRMIRELEIEWRETEDFDHQFEIEKTIEYLKTGKKVEDEYSFELLKREYFEKPEIVNVIKYRESLYKKKYKPIW